MAKFWVEEQMRNENNWNHQLFVSWNSETFFNTQDYIVKVCRNLTHLKHTCLFKATGLKTYQFI